MKQFLIQLSASSLRKLSWDYKNTKGIQFWRDALPLLLLYASYSDHSGAIDPDKGKDKFCMKMLGMGKDKYYNTKSFLIDQGFIRIGPQKRDEGTGHFGKNNIHITAKFMSYFTQYEQAVITLPDEVEGDFDRVPNQGHRRCPDSRMSVNKDTYNDKDNTDSDKDFPVEGSSTGKTNRSAHGNFNISPTGENLPSSQGSTPVKEPAKEKTIQTEEKGHSKQGVHEVTQSFEELSKYEGYVIRATSDFELVLKRSILEMAMSSDNIPKLGSPRKKVIESALSLDVSVHDFLDSLLYWIAVQSEKSPERCRDMIFWIQRHAKNYHDRPDVKTIGLMKEEVKIDIHEQAKEVVRLSAQIWGKDYSHYENKLRPTEFWKAEVTAVEALMRATGSKGNELKVIAVVCANINHSFHEWQDYYDGSVATFQWDNDIRLIVEEAQEKRKDWPDFDRKLLAAENHFNYKLPG